MDAPSYWSRYKDLSNTQNIHVAKHAASDGCPIFVVEIGSKERADLVLVNPPGTPFLLMSRLGLLLGTRYRVTSWENRGSPYLDVDIGEVNSAEISIERLAIDFCEILRAREISRPHVVAHCGGLSFILRACAESGVELSSLSLISPPPSISSVRHPTAFDAQFAPQLGALAQASSDTFDEILRSLKLFVSGPQLKRQDERTLVSLCRESNRTDQLWRDFAIMWNSFWPVLDEEKLEQNRAMDLQLMAAVGKVIPVSIFQPRDDPVVDYRCSIEAAVRNLSKMILYPTGGHFLPYRQPALLARDIFSFLSGATEQTV